MVVAEFEAGGVSAKSLRLRHKIGRSMTIMSWVHQYGSRSVSCIPLNAEADRAAVSVLPLSHQELAPAYGFNTFEQAKAVIAQAIECYNYLRIHSAIGYKTPATTYFKSTP